MMQCRLQCHNNVPKFEKIIGRIEDALFIYALARHLIYSRLSLELFHELFLSFLIELFISMVHAVHFFADIIFGHWQMTIIFIFESMTAE